VAYDTTFYVGLVKELGEPLIEFCKNVSGSTYRITKKPECICVDPLYIFACLTFKRNMDKFSVSNLSEVREKLVEYKARYFM